MFSSSVLWSLGGCVVCVCVVCLCVWCSKQRVGTINVPDDVLLPPQVGLVLQWRRVVSECHRQAWRPRHGPKTSCLWKGNQTTTFLLSDLLMNFDLHYCCQAEGAPPPSPSINGPQSHRRDRRKQLYFTTVPKTWTVPPGARPPSHSPPANLRKPVNTDRRDRGEGPNAQSRTDCFVLFLNVGSAFCN